MSATKAQQNAQKKRRRQWAYWFRDSPLYPTLLFVAVIVFWQYVLVRGLIPFVPTRYIGSPSGILHSFIKLWNKGYQGIPLIDEITSSLTRVLLGFFIGAVIATPLGLFMGHNKFIGRLFGPLFGFLRPVPALAFIPVMLIWFGIGNVGRIVLIAMTAFLYIVLATSAGVAAVPKAYLRAAHNYQLSSIRTLFSIILPASLPSILIGFRTGMALSWAVVVAAEMIAAQEGLGYMIKDAATFFRIDVVYVGIILIGIIGVFLDWIFTLAQRRVLHWVGQ